MESAARQLAEQGWKLQLEQRFEEAEKLYQEALAKEPKCARALMYMGILGRQTGREAMGLDYLRQAAKANPDEAVFHFNLGNAQDADGIFDEAEGSFRRAIELKPDFARALLNMGILARKTGRDQLGLYCLRRAAAVEPNNAVYHYNLGNALDEDRLFEEAEASFRRAVEIDPNYVNALMNLGNVLQTLSKHHEAIEVFQKVIKIDPKSGAAHHNLARVHDGMGSQMPALLEYMESSDLDRSVATLSTLSSFLRRIGDSAQAIKIAQEAVELDGKEALGWMRLGQAHEANGDKEEAAKAYRQAVAADPKNDQAAFFLALVENTTPALASREYISQHYDGFAENFDAHLKKLSYRTPEQIFAAIERLLSERAVAIQPPWDIFDVGCGTGLCGLLFVPLAKLLIGVDVSQEMLRRAAMRNIYKELLLGDLAEELRKRPAGFDMVLASDVLIHLGDLQNTFAGAATALRAGGLFAFSVERHEGPENYTLLPTRRFAHSLPYLRKLAAEAGLVEQVAETIALRKEGGADVMGYLVVLQKK